LGNRRWYADVLAELGNLACVQGDYAQAKALFEESLSTAHSVYDQSRATHALYGLVTVALEERIFAQARVLLKQIAASVREFEGTPLLAMFFFATARLASLTTASEHAACLMGATQTALRQAKSYLYAFDQAAYDAVQSTLRLALSEEVFDRIYAEGQAMSLETALAYAADEVLG
jgi:hypothetical protein